MQNEKLCLRRGNILRIDETAGLVAGIVVWLFSDVLIARYEIPPWLLSTNILANISDGMSASLLQHGSPPGQSSHSVVCCLYAVVGAMSHHGSADCTHGEYLWRRAFRV